MNNQEQYPAPHQAVQIPELKTKETERLREDYPQIVHLEAGDVAGWLVERKEQLLARAQQERVGMNLAKTITLAGAIAGTVCYAVNPLGVVAALVAGVGYAWTVVEDLNDSHQFAPLPFIRGNIIEFLEAMGDADHRQAYLQQKDPLVDLMFHLPPEQRAEFVMLRQFTHVLTSYLAGVDSGKRFYAYRWLLDCFVLFRGTFPTVEELQNHLITVTADTRVDYGQVAAIQAYQSRMKEARVNLPHPQAIALPQPNTTALPVGINTQLNAIEVGSSPANTTAAAVSSIPQQYQYLLGLPLPQRSEALIDLIEQSGFEISKAVAQQITCICGNQRGGKGTLMAILATLTCALEPNTKIHYFTAGDDVYPVRCDRLVCRLSFPGVDGQEADRLCAKELLKYLTEMDNHTQGQDKNIILVIDEAVALSDYLSPEDRVWIVRFLLTRANKKGAQIFVVLHGNNLTSWVGTGNTGGFSSTFKQGASFVGCEAKNVKISKLRTMATATGRYFIADPDEFAKPVEGGELGCIPEWLKTQSNPQTGQPDPARGVLAFFPELRDDSHASAIYQPLRESPEYTEATRAAAVIDEELEEVRETELIDPNFAEEMEPQIQSSDSRHNDLFFVMAMATIAKDHMRENHWQSTVIDIEKVRKINRYKDAKDGAGRHLNKAEAKAVIEFLEFNDVIAEVEEGIYKVNP